MTTGEELAEHIRRTEEAAEFGLLGANKVVVIDSNGKELSLEELERLDPPAMVNVKVVKATDSYFSETSELEQRIIDVLKRPMRLAEFGSPAGNNRAKRRAEKFARKSRRP